MIGAIIAIVLAIVGQGCGAAPSYTLGLQAPTKTLTTIKRTGTLTPHASETTPVVLNGQVLYVSFDRSANQAIEIRNGSGTLLHSYPSTHIYGSALVVGQRLYVFATSSDYLSIGVAYTDDLVILSPFTTILTALPNQTFYNTSVAPGPSGYVMSYEVREMPSMPAFSFRFAQSPDLVTWTKVGTLFSNTYSACPTVRYFSGTYYVLFLAHTASGYETWAARSTDLTHFQMSPYVVLAPISPDSNASDMDLVELNGVTYINFFEGNQVDSDKVETAIYQGTEEQFFQSLFQ